MRSANDLTIHRKSMANQFVAQQNRPLEAAHGVEAAKIAMVCFNNSILELGHSLIIYQDNVTSQRFNFSVPAPAEEIIMDSGVNPGLVNATAAAKHSAAQITLSRT
jgi:hypothetical protein